MKNKNIAVIFAGGSGKRMKANIPKQFLKVYGKEIIIHTLEKFQYNDNIDLIYIGCIKEYIDELKELLKKYNITKVPENGIVAGGATGQETIYNILSRVEEENSSDSIVLIHDGVRPIIDDEIINKNIDSVKKYRSAITVTKAFETPIISKDGESITEVLNRNYVYTAQAPQSFYLKDILSCHEIIRKTKDGYENPKIVDSCSLVKECGKEVHLIEGKRGNIKVTTYDDYAILLANLSVNDYIQMFKLID